jgi:hypothetical protein
LAGFNNDNSDSFGDEQMKQTLLFVSMAKNLVKDAFGPTDICTG